MICRYRPDFGAVVVSFRRDTNAGGGPNSCLSDGPAGGRMTTKVTAPALAAGIVPEPVGPASVRRPLAARYFCVCWVFFIFYPFIFFIYVFIYLFIECFILYVLFHFFI